MKTFMVILLLALSSVQSFSQDTTGTIIILSDKIGPTIDLEERNLYKMLVSIENFESAVLLQRSDGSYIFKIITKNVDEPSFKTRWIFITAEEVERIRHHIDPNYWTEDYAVQVSDSIKSKSKKKISRWRPITEFGYGYQITPPLKIKSIQTEGDSVIFINERQVKGRHYLTSELGYIYNLNAKYGLGFTHFTGWNFDEYLCRGLKLRMRKWLTPKTSLDFSGGAILWGGYYDLKQPVFIAGASLAFSNWEAVNLLIEVLETQPHDWSYYRDGVEHRCCYSRRRNIGISLGYKLSSKPGLVFNEIAGIALAAGTLIYLLLYAVLAGPD